MPLYEYYCTDCSKTFTVLQTLHVNPNETTCASCGTNHVKKQFSVFASNIEGKTDSSVGDGGHACPASACGCV